MFGHKSEHSSTRQRMPIAPFDEVLLPNEEVLKPTNHQVHALASMWHWMRPNTCAPLVGGNRLGETALSPDMFGEETQAVVAARRREKTRLCSCNTEGLSGVWFVLALVLRIALFVCATHAVWVCYREFTNISNVNKFKKAEGWVHKCSTPPFDIELSRRCDSLTQWFVQGYRASVLREVWEDHKGHLRDFGAMIVALCGRIFTVPTICSDNCWFQIRTLENMLISYIGWVVPLGIAFLYMAAFQNLKSDIARNVCGSKRTRKRGRKSTHGHRRYQSRRRPPSLSPVPRQLREPVIHDMGLAGSDSSDGYQSPSSESAESGDDEYASDHERENHVQEVRGFTRAAVSSRLNAPAAVSGHSISGLGEFPGVGLRMDMDSMQSDPARSLV